MDFYGNRPKKVGYNLGHCESTLVETSERWVPARWRDFICRPKTLFESIPSPAIGGGEGYVNTFQRFVSVYQNVRSTEVDKEWLFGRLETVGDKL